MEARELRREPNAEERRRHHDEDAQRFQTEHQGELEDLQCGIVVLDSSTPLQMRRILRPNVSQVATRNEKERVCAMRHGNDPFASLRFLLF